jgi:CHAT domain-containing protein/tetratricopeptide (TPR) repeat protein
VAVGGLADGASAAQHPTSAPTTFEACDALVAEAPLRRSAYSCYYGVGRLEGRYEEAAERLSAFTPDDPGYALARFTLANVYVDSARAREAEGEMRRALEAMPAAVPAGDRAILMLDYANLLRDRGRFDEAYEVLDQAGELAEGSEATWLAGAVDVQRARTMIKQGTDRSRARELLQRALSGRLAEYPYPVRQMGLEAQRTLAGHDGRTADVESLRGRIIAEAETIGDDYVVAAVRKGSVSDAAYYADQRVPAQVAAVVADATAALEFAEAAGNRHAAADLHCIRAGFQRGAEAVADARACLSQSEDLEDVAGLLGGHLSLALALARSGETNAAEVRGHLDAAAEIAEEDGDLEGQVRVCARRRVVDALASDYAALVAGAPRCFELLELLADIQGDATDRRMVRQEWVFLYYELAGTLLGRPDRTDEDIDAAFGVMERHRARAGLAELRAADADLLDEDDPLQLRHRAALVEISMTQKALLLPGLDDAERKQTLARLSELEVEERDLRAQLVRSEPAFARTHAPVVPRLDEVRAFVEPDQAVLVYQLADPLDEHGIPEGGSWLTVITRASVRVIALPPRSVLADRVAMLSGLYARRDGAARAPGQQMYADLLGDAISGLPPEVRRLTIVPDAELYDVPFVALAPTADGEPLVAAYAVSLTPSVTGWMSWPTSVPSRPAAVLAIAQPQLGYSEGQARERGGTLQTGLRLGDLPRARQEVHAVARVWSGDASVRVGDDASESALKQTSLDQYGVLHFATHAVVDRDHPARSAVVLAPGSEDEDGLLQAREIAGLHLQGQLVVLSACSGAAGQRIRGEGVLSLSRAFLHAGARAVVASRWPLADEDALPVFERFYAHLEDGRSVSVALANAQRELWEAGAPPASWAGLLVVGDGNAVLVPARVNRWRGWVAAGGASLLALTAFGWSRRRRARPSAA